jgi:predicted SAM-dependent methyltransferase
MNIKKIQRNKDVINGCEDLEYLDKFDDYPVFMGCVNQPFEDDILIDMQWAISKNSGIIQLSSVLPLDVLYSEDHGAGVVGTMWLKHHKEFAKFIQKQSPQSILEIGGSHGILSREYKKMSDIDWTILEPNPVPAADVDALFIKGFFDDQFTFNGEIDAIVHSHVFEHVYYPNEFITHISNYLEEGQKLIFSFPNMEEMLKRKYTNCINFEHTVLLTEPYVDYLLSKHGFREVDKEYFQDDHSIFYSFVKDSTVETITLSDGLYEHNKKMYLDYVDYHKQLINDLNTKIKNTSDNQNIYLFGAHVFAQSLIEFGLDTSRIVCLLDNDKNKQSKRLYGTSMLVESPKILKGVSNPIVILKAGVYNSEISSDILDNINSHTIFWE